MKISRSKFIVILSSVFISLSLWASDGDIYLCETPNTQRDLLIMPDRVAFLPLDQSSRTPASEVPVLVRRHTASGLIRVALFEGHRYRIEIRHLQGEGQSGFITQRSSAGHEITYPIQCQKRD